MTIPPQDEDVFYLVPLTEDELQIIQRALDAQLSPYMPKPLAMVTSHEHAVIVTALATGVEGGLHTPDDLSRES